MEVGKKEETILARKARDDDFLGLYIKAVGQGAVPWLFAAREQGGAGHRH
jgi:hypothetical protein